MPPVPPESSDLVNRLRQQLILAQVRIMELEDVRDAQAPRLVELEELLRSAQTLADLKSEEAAHLGRVLADTQAHAARLQQLLTENSRDLAAAQAAMTESQTRLALAHSTQRDLEASLQAAVGELRILQASRSWRWTAWLRALARPSPRPRA